MKVNKENIVLRNTVVNGLKVELLKAAEGKTLISLHAFSELTETIYTCSSIQNTDV